MMSSRLILTFPKCWQQFIRVTVVEQKCLAMSLSTCYASTLQCGTKTSKETEISWKCRAVQSLFHVPVRCVQTDEKSTSEQLVYKGQLQNSVKRLKILTLSTSVGALCIQPSVLSKLWETNPYLAYSLGIISTLFIVATPLIVHLFTRRYVTDLYFNPETKIFTATTLTVFLRKKKTIFTAEDVYVPAIPGFFTTFIVRNTPMFVDSGTVVNIEAYQHLLGFDKPIDFHFGKSAGEKKNAS